MTRQLMAAACGALLLGAAMAPVHAASGNGPALEINIGGIGPAVDAKAYAKVRLLISEAVFSNTIEYFNVSGYGKEGGFSACIEKGRFAAEGSFERLTRALKAIRVDRSTSFYNVQEARLCPYPIATPVVPVKQP